MRAADGRLVWRFRAAPVDRRLVAFEQVEFVDIYPTLCDLAGWPSPEGLEGRSMAPLLSHPDQPWKEAAFSQFPRQDGSAPLMGCAMRTERYRYIEWRDRRTREAVAARFARSSGSCCRSKSCSALGPFSGYGTYSTDLILLPHFFLAQRDSKCFKSQLRAHEIRSLPNFARFLVSQTAQSLWLRPNAQNDSGRMLNEQEETEAAEGLRLCYLCFLLFKVAWRKGESSVIATV